MNRTGSLLLFVSLISLARCSTVPAKETVHFELVDGRAVSDSIAAQDRHYKEDFNFWKTVYNQCLHDSLFEGALYLGLGNHIGIGSINNLLGQNINKQITVLDTTANSNLFDILAINKSANCYSKINENKSLQDSFYLELLRNLKSSGDSLHLIDLIDTNQIIFTIPSMTDYSIRPDTLISLLDRTQDSSLLYFKKILITPGNVLLIRAVMIFGFAAEFNLKRKLNSADQEKLKKPIYFLFGPSANSGSISMLTDQRVKVSLNKYYTVFAQFASFR